MQRQNTHVTVFEAEQYDRGWPSDDLLDFAGWLRLQINAIPPEFRSNATIRIGSVSGYENSSYASICIEYHRPETDGEMKERCVKSARSQEAVEAQERFLFSKLQIKYGSKG